MPLKIKACTSPPILFARFTPNRAAKMEGIAIAAAVLISAALCMKNLVEPVTVAKPNEVKETPAAEIWLFVCMYER